MKDLVSVIIPTYNRSQFVTEAVESVLCQTYPNIELIVVNDGSTDDTEEKLKPYMDSIIYIKKENGGVSSAVNTGLRTAKGKYIARLDDDDLFMPDKIEKQVEVFEENPDIGLVTSGCFIIDSAGRIISVRKAPDFSQYGAFLTLLLPLPGIFQPTVMVRRECHEKLGFYKDVFAEDYEMFLRISRYWDVSVVDQPLAKYRRHSGNITALLPGNEELRQFARDFIRDILDDVQLTELFPVLNHRPDAYCRSCAYAARSALYLRQKFFDKAEADLLRSIRLHPYNPISLLWLSILARSREQFSLAEKYLSKIQKSDDLNSIVQNFRDLTIAFRKGPDRDSVLLKKELVKEYNRLFKITFDRISGKASKKGAKYISKPATDRLRLSRYVVVVDDYPKKGEYLLFNTFTHAMAKIGDEFRNFIRNPGASMDQDVSSNLRMLRRMGILVNEGADETKMVRKWHDTIRNSMLSMRAIILTTYDCNFDCEYCIEEEVKRCVYMDDSCSDSVAEWLINRVKENKTEDISLLFYGGEPLLNPRPMYRISRRMQQFAFDNGVQFSSSITTNGSLLDSKMLRELTDYGLKSVKVTVDGRKKVHDSRRPFKNGRGSFDTIIGNIRNMLDEDIELTIQVNLDEKNIGDFPDLLDFFEKSELEERIDYLTISPVFHLPAEIPLLGYRGLDCTGLSDPQIVDGINCMKRLARERGFKSRNDGIRYVTCSMNRKGSAIFVDPLGDVYNCPAFVGKKEFSVGNIYRSEIDYGEGIPADRLEKCIQCRYFPVCGGGCRYISYKLYGDDSVTYCERSSIEYRTRELIKLAYDQKVDGRPST